jgi:preprotein translocase subunit SecA
MAQRDPLIEYQREGYQMFQSMMGQIKEESVGYLYNLEVEVRNDRGQVQQAATNRMRQAAANAAAAGAAAPQQAPAEPAARGAFGQRTDGGQGQQDAAPQNRAQRRAADRRK